MPNAPRTFKPGGSKPARKAWQRSKPNPRTLRGRKLQETKQRILMRDGCECQKCGKLVDYGDSILDHRKPLSQGGTDDDTNLQTLCVKCSKIKTQKESQDGKK